MSTSHKNSYGDIRVETSEKAALYEEEPASGLHIRYLILLYSALFLALFISMPKIWLSSSIYYISRDINKLQTQSDLLKEEHKRLQNERESLRYQYLKTQSTPNTPTSKEI